MRPAMLAVALAAIALPAGAEAPALHEARCGACHGEAGRSAQPHTPSLAGMPAEFTVLQMILFREGLRDAPPMPQFAAGLSDAQIQALADFYASLPPGPPADRGPRDAALAERGAALAGRMHCASCHLPDYRGRAQMPRLAGQREEYLALSLRAYRDNRRVGTDTQMNAAMYGVNDADIEALAHYLAHRE